MSSAGTSAVQTWTCRTLGVAWYLRWLLHTRRESRLIALPTGTETVPVDVGPLRQVKRRPETRPAVEAKTPFERSLMSGVARIPTAV
jgi:hypothetical protein